MQEKQEIHSTHKRFDTARVLIEIETLQWVLSQSLNIRRQPGQDERYHY